MGIITWQRGSSLKDVERAYLAGRKLDSWTWVKEGENFFLDTLLYTYTDNIYKKNVHHLIHTCISPKFFFLSIPPVSNCPTARGWVLVARVFSHSRWW